MSSLVRFAKMNVRILRSIFVYRNPKTITIAGGTVILTDVMTAFDILLNGADWQDGPNIQRLEEMFKNYLDAKYAVSFNGARVALRAILEAMDIGEGDEVILPGYTCVVVPNALLYRGIRPIYVDIDPNTFNFSIDKLQRSISQKTKAIVIPYNYGIVPDNLSALIDLSKKNRLRVIEDCAPALGASYKGKKVGTLGDAAIISTEQTKCISTQFGGMAITMDPHIGEKLIQIQKGLPFPSFRQIRTRLFQFIINYLICHPVLSMWLNPSLTLLQLLPGLSIQSTNRQEMCGIEPRDHYARMPNALATLGLRQLKYIDQYNNHRRSIADIYNRILSAYPTSVSSEVCSFREGEAPAEPSENGIQNVYLRYPILVPKNRNRIIVEVSKRGFLLGEWFNSPIHPQGSALDTLMYTIGSCPQAEQVAERIVNLPTHPNVTKKDAKKIANLLLKYMNLVKF